jgi:hypothetical protein
MPVALPAGPGVVVDEFDDGEEYDDDGDELPDDCWAMAAPARIRADAEVNATT